MKCLTLHQPWATFMVLGLKKIETRSWQTSYRGPLAIHAAKKKIESRHKLGLHIVIFTDKFKLELSDLPRGDILCIGELIDCQKITIYNKPSSSQERLLGNYTPGRYMWIFKDMYKLVKPIPYRGWQRIFNVPDEVFLGKKVLLWR